MKFMKLKSLFSSILLRHREERHLTQSEVAEAVSVGSRWYQKIERGTRLPGTVTMLRLLVFLEIDVNELSETLGLIKPVGSNQRQLLHR